MHECMNWIPFRFDQSTEISGFNQAKSSMVRGVRAKLLDQYPPLADHMDDVISKKEAVQIIKWCVSPPPHPPGCAIHAII